MWVNGIKKKKSFMLFGFFFSCGEKGQVEDEEKCVRLLGQRRNYRSWQDLV